MIPAAASLSPEPQPPVLTRRFFGGNPAALRLALSAEERQCLRGRRHSVCGRPLLLHLPRGEALQPGELLAPASGDELLVRVEAAPEPLLQVRAADPLALLQAAYHLGNRHVALEIQPGELRLLQDPVLAHLLEYRGLWLQAIVAPFLPESGAYGHADAHSNADAHSHADGHGHAHGHSHDHGHSHAAAHSHDG
ncbi:urease accessory protein UreE [Synechococcus sp. CBW1107]|uniref:urease accessory protein UreE n=1 Tax=Synechococcus sp. CBW1107 TaxID=2789857 RepID=UPI002AD20985|nr:urease accessory protein UreE [Synechococcus sp. CBW1107]CAK6688038.1 Urease accessory protein UreE [Synechococcus sp. CBW1107]